MKSDLKSDHVVDGQALDQETIIRQRPLIEEWVNDNVGIYTRTELYWSYNKEQNLFDFEIHFFQ